jgi:tRNA pseudouridine13 synthase
MATVKLRRRPEDFRVEELSEFRADGGPFALYRLTKRSLGTPEALEAVARRWNVSRRQIGYGGLKDRHAETTQFVTIHRGPRRALRQTNLELEYLGQAARPFAARDISGNRFQIVVRSLDPARRAEIETSLAEVRRDGVPNYFDDQRFGSVGRSGEFVALAWCRGDYERALWLALAEENDHDRPEDRQNKEALRQHWGDWAACQRQLTRSHARSIVSFLAQHPRDFRRAVALLRIDLRGLYLAALQSHLWNLLLAAWLRDHVAKERRFDVRIAAMPVPFFRGLTADERSEMLAQELPLPSARLHLPPGPLQQFIEATLSEAGVTLRELRVKYPRDSFFSRGNRRAAVEPAALQHSWSGDDSATGRKALALRFDLVRGAYATVVVKRLTQGNSSTELSSAE